MKKETIINATHSITINKKKFNRIAKTLNGVNVVEWRRSKTGHEVKKVEFDFLENEFAKKYGVQFIDGVLKNIRTTESTSKPNEVNRHYDTVKDREYLLNIVSPYIQDGNLLVAVKKIKDITNSSLRDAKNFVDLCKAIIEVREKSASIPYLSISERKKLEESLLVFSENGTNLLKGVKYVKEATGWGLRDAKDFVDCFFKIKRAKDLCN